MTARTAWLGIVLGLWANCPVFAADEIPVTPNATLHATLIATGAPAVFTILGVGAWDVVLPPARLAKVLLPVGKITITAAAPCYPPQSSLLQLDGSRNNETFSFTFADFDRKPNCNDPPRSAGAAPNGNADQLAWVITNSTFNAPWPDLSFVDQADRPNMTGLLQKAGFQIKSSQNRTLVDLTADFADFGRMLAAKPWRSVVVYLSGHGIGWQGHTYFVPADAPPPGNETVDRFFDIARIVALLDAQTAHTGQFGIILVDACRRTDSVGTEAGPPPVMPSHVLLNYSAAAGSASYENNDSSLPPGSVWTNRFLEVAQAQPQLSLDQIALYANRFVTWESRQTTHAQIPVLYGRLPATAPPLDPTAPATGMLVPPITP